MQHIESISDYFFFLIFIIMDASMTEKMNILDNIQKNLQVNNRRKIETIEEEYRIKSQPNDMGIQQLEQLTINKLQDRRKQFNKLVISDNEQSYFKQQMPVQVEEKAPHLEQPNIINNFMIKQNDDDELLLDQPLPEQIQFKPFMINKLQEQSDMSELSVQTSRVEMPKHQVPFQERKVSEERKSPKKSELRPQPQKRMSQQIPVQVSNKLQDMTQKSNQAHKDMASPSKNKRIAVPQLNISTVENEKTKPQSNKPVHSTNVSSNSNDLIFQKIIWSLQENQKQVSSFYEEFIDSEKAKEISIFFKIGIEKVINDYNSRQNF